jgi:phage-related protein
LADKFTSVAERKGKPKRQEKRRPTAPAVGGERKVAHRWRDYQTGSGRRPVKEFLGGLGDEDLASVVAAMKDVRHRGLEAARHLDGDIYEVRAGGKGVIYRVLFAPEGRYKQVFLSLEAFKKKTQKTPPGAISLAKRRLRDWQARGN